MAGAMLSVTVQLHAQKRAPWHALAVSRLPRMSHLPAPPLLMSAACQPSRCKAHIRRIRSVDLFHLGGLVSSALDFLKRWEIVIVTKALVIVIDAESKLDHSVNSACELRRLVKIEARSEEKGVEKKPNEVLDGLVGFVGSRLLLELTHDGMLWVHFHGLLGNHVRRHGTVTERLGFHDAFHVRAPAIFGRGEHARRVGHAGSYNNLFDLVAQHLLHELGKWFEFRFQLLHFLLFVFVINVQAFLSDGFQFLTIKLFELLDRVLIDGINHVKYFEAFLAERLQERRRRNSSDALAGDIVDVVLTLFHAVHIFLEADLFVTRL